MWRNRRKKHWFFPLPNPLIKGFLISQNHHFLRENHKVLKSCNEWAVGEFFVEAPCVFIVQKSSPFRVFFVPFAVLDISCRVRKVFFAFQNRSISRENHRFWQAFYFVRWVSQWFFLICFCINRKFQVILIVQKSFRIDDLDGQLAKAINFEQKHSFPAKW